MEKSDLQGNKEVSEPKKGPATWAVGIEMFSRISTWIVVPIVAALIFGKMLDKKFGTEPTIFLSLAGLGFSITVYGILKIVKDYNKDNK